MDNSDVVLVESSDEEVFRDNPTSQTSFNLAPPNVCERWTAATTVLSSRKVISSRTYLTPEKKPDLQPIITEVKSLSPLKTQHTVRKFPTFSTQNNFLSGDQSVAGPGFGRYPIITEVKSLSPIKAQISSSGISSSRTAVKFGKVDLKSSTKVSDGSGGPVCIILDDDCDDTHCENASSVKLENPLEPEDIHLLENKCSSGSKIDTEEYINCQSVDTILEETSSVDATTEPVSSIKKRIRPVRVNDEMAGAITIHDFINACKGVEDSEDMETILQKKVMKHFNNADSSWKNSSSFQKILKKKKESIEKNRDDLYVHISELVDEMKARKGQKKLEEEVQEPARKKAKLDKIDYADVENSRMEKKIKKLTQTLEILQKKIKKLETEEVSWEDEDDANSPYIMLQRYKERAAKVFDKLCDYTKESKSAGKISKIHYSGTPFPQVNKCIQTFVNQTGNFPDYVDILDIIKKVNSEDNVLSSDKELEDIAKKAFLEVGEELQRQRRHGVGESLLSFIDNKYDPADENPELRKALNENKTHWQKINDIIEEFASRPKEKKKAGTDDDEEDDGEDDDNDDNDNDDDDDDDDNDDGGDEEGSDEIDDPELKSLLNSSEEDDKDSSGLPAIEACDTNIPVVQNNGKVQNEMVISEDSENTIKEGKEVCDSSTIESQNKDCGSVDMGEREVQEEKNTVKSEPLESRSIHQFKIRVKSAKSLGAVDFDCSKNSNTLVTMPNDIIVLD